MFRYRINLIRPPRKPWWRPQIDWVGVRRGVSTLGDAVLDISTVVGKAALVFVCLGVIGVLGVQSWEKEYQPVAEPAAVEVPAAAPAPEPSPAVVVRCFSDGVLVWEGLTWPEARGMGCIKDKVNSPNWRLPLKGEQDGQ